MADNSECVTCGLLESTVRATGVCGGTGKPDEFSEEKCARREIVKRGGQSVDQFSTEYWKSLALRRADAIDDLIDERDHWKRVAEWHKSKADTWLTAYQKSRVKNVGDYTRFFVRRPRMRRLIVRLMRL